MGSEYVGSVPTTVEVVPLNRTIVDPEPTRKPSEVGMSECIRVMPTLCL